MIYSYKANFDYENILLSLKGKLISIILIVLDKSDLYKLIKVKV